MSQRNFVKNKRPKNNLATEIVSGVNPIYEILRADTRVIEKVWIAHKHETGLVDKILNYLYEKKIPVQKASREEICNISRIEKNQGIAARVSLFNYSSLEDVLEIGRKDPHGHFILVLDSILDPQNLGSIIRTAYLIGVHGIIIPERNSAQIGPASTRASAGAVEYIPIVRVTNISKTLESLKKSGIWVAGAEVGGKNVYSHEFSGSYALVVGSEGKGIRRLVKENCDELVAIPINATDGGVASYNVSVAAGILLAEAARQRASKKEL